MKDIASDVPAIRVRPGNREAVRGDGDFVLYWMIAARRVDWSFGLDRAVDWARGLGRPLVVLEALRCGYRWASERLHRFVIDGMTANARRLAGTPVVYLPYVEPEPGAGSGLLEALGRRACVVVTDRFPCFFLPRMVAAAGRRLPVRLEEVDGNGLLPLDAADRAFPTAHSFRRFLQKTLPDHLDALPRAHQVYATLPRPPAGLLDDVARRWPRAPLEDGLERDLPIDHAVQAVEGVPGGAEAGKRAWRAFRDGPLADYAGGRNDVDAETTSGLSPWLHFGHVSPHQVLHDLARAERWSPARLARRTDGSRRGWWGMSEGAEAFLDQLVTWRELGFNLCAREPDRYDDYASLPEWARTTLEEHADDERPRVYDLRTFDGARTHDAVWNAAQRQLRRDGRIHNYLRMLWGKKILHWSATPRDALATMIELNNRYALDGRDPNSYSGIFWCLGRYDRAWGPERPVFGKVRYMSSESTRRKLRLAGYLERYGA